VLFNKSTCPKGLQRSRLAI